MKTFLSFVKKEYLHILRDRATLSIIILMPVVLIVLFGYAISTEIRESSIAVMDNSRDDLTRRTISQLDAGEYFRLTCMVSSYAEIDSLFKEGKIEAAIVFPAGYEERTVRGERAEAGIITDGTNPNEATMVAGYAESIIISAAAGYFYNESQLSAIEVRNTLLYNPMMKSAYNFVPGVMGLILILICAMMTSVGIVREREAGTMEVLLVSPLRPLYIVVAKAVPYLILSIINVVTILLISVFILDVPISGSVWTVMLLAALYCMVALSLGLLISTIADSGKSALLISGIGLMLPVMLLSGMIFPIENMPFPLRVISNVVPAKWFIMALKNVMIKGLGIGYVVKEIGVMIFMTLFFAAISVKRFKIRLE